METAAVVLDVREKHVQAFEARFREPLAFGGKTVVQPGIEAG